MHSTKAPLLCVSRSIVLLAPTLLWAFACAPALLPGTDRTDAGVPPDATSDAGPLPDATPDADDGDATTLDAAVPEDATDDGDAACDGSCTLAFASGPDWESYAGDLSGADGGDLGPAQPVCLTVLTPPNCPSNAVIFTPAGTGWGAPLTAIPGAEWVWSAGVRPTEDASLAIAVFQKTFDLGTTPSGWIAIAADNYGEVLVNGHHVGSVGSVTDSNLSVDDMSRLHTFVLTPYLTSGLNTVAVVGQNAAGGIYAGNPAGVVFGGSFSL